MHSAVENSGEQDEYDKPRAPAIVGKGHHGSLLKILHEEFRTEIGRDTRYDHTHKNKLKRLACLTKKLWDLQRARQENQRRSQQEGEAGRVFIIETNAKSADHRDAGA